MNRLLLLRCQSSAVPTR